jgi:hypothetical protein
MGRAESVVTVSGCPGESGHCDGEGNVVRWRRPSGITLLPTGAFLVTDEGRLRG